MANSKINVPVFGTVGKKVAINLNATTGATIGTDLKLPNGTVPSLAQLAAALGVAPAGAATNPNVLWQQLAEVPPNIVAVQNLATAGLVRRLPNGDWITQPPSDFQGRPGAPGRQGARGFPGVPGAPGVAGNAGAAGASGVGIPGRRGTRGRNGFPGPAGATGATGPQGPAGSASSGTGFPGYRQRKPPRPRLLPWHDTNATSVWGGPQLFRGPMQRSVTGTPYVSIGNDGPFPGFSAVETSQAVDNRIWEVASVSGALRIQTVNDAQTAGSLALNIVRSGNTISSIALGNINDKPTVGINGGANTTLSILSPDINGLSGISVWDKRFTIFGPNVASTTGAACGFGYDQTNDKSVFLSLAPGVAWKPFQFSGSNFELVFNGTATTNLKFTGAPATGGTSPSFLATNKPGTASGGGVSTWLPVQFNGNQYDIPMWLRS